MRARVLVLAIASVAMAASCDEDDADGRDFSCAEPRSGGHVGTGWVEFTVRKPIVGNETLAFCASRSILSEGRATLVFTEQPGFTVILPELPGRPAVSGSVPRKSLVLTLWNVDGDVGLDLDFDSLYSEGFDARNCDDTRTRLDATGAEGAFSCVDRSTDASGTYFVNLSTISSTNAPPAATPTTPAPAPTMPSSTVPPEGAHCGGVRPSGAASGTVQFAITGAHTGSGSLPLCSHFSSFSDAETFLVFTNNAEATEADGLIVSLGPDRNTFQFFPPLTDVPFEIADCSVTLSRDDASGLSGTFSCDDLQISGIKVNGTFVVDR